MVSHIRGFLVAGAVAVFGAALSNAHAASIRFAPGDNLILNRANEQGMFDFVLHTIGLTTAPGEHFTLKRLRIDVMKDGEPVLTKYVAAARMIEDTGALTAPPQDIFLGAQLLTAKGAPEFFGAGVAPAKSAALAPRQFLLLTRQHFSVDFAPNEVRVTAEGDSRTAAARLPVQRYESRISYSLPLDGAWALHSLPMIASHHRLNPSTEFAVDFFKTDGEGRNLVGDPAAAANALGYGAPVKAAAAGEVVFVIADDVQDRATYLPQPGEDPQARGARIGAFNMQRYAKDMRRGAAGNIVTIKHEANGAIEYTSYGHLKSGSIKVRSGDRVSQGQVIGEVGDTGDSPAVHLHFQVNSGPDAFNSKSLPAQFADLKYQGSSRDPARFVTNGK